jgi:hypothetical protein
MKSHLFLGSFPSCFRLASPLCISWTMFFGKLYWKVKKNVADFKSRLDLKGKGQ